MRYFRITNPASGLVLGVYPGTDKAAALDTYAQDAGYPSFAAACEVTGGDPDDDADLTVTEIQPGTLYDYRTGDYIRPATIGETAASMNTAQHDGGAGAILADGRSCYVVGE